jgi:hypothetical protein
MIWPTISRRVVRNVIVLVYIGGLIVCAGVLSIELLSGFETKKSKAQEDPASVLQRARDDIDVLKAESKYQSAKTDLLRQDISDLRADTRVEAEKVYQIDRQLDRLTGWFMWLLISAVLMAVERIFSYIRPHINGNERHDV